MSNNINWATLHSELLIEGLFSEYLPPCFSVNDCLFDEYKLRYRDKYDSISPYDYTMSRFNSEYARRHIQIPEITSYFAVNLFIEENKILQDLYDNILIKSESFSPVIMDDGTFLKHDLVYDPDSFGSDTKIVSNYIDNIIAKIKRSVGAKKVLKLDIANCYRSIYTHRIPSIRLGLDKANEEFKQPAKKRSPLYQKYDKFDKYVRRQNRNQTNGLLVGPQLSNIIVEAMLTKIDIDLKDRGLKFSRYVDDYEFYLYADADETEVMQIFTNVINKYSLTINHEKTEIVDFPFYAINNFDKIISSYKNMSSRTGFDLIELFHKFIAIENEGVKGATRYLLKNLNYIDVSDSDREVMESYVASIMANDARSLTKACMVLLKCWNEEGYSSGIILSLVKMLRSCIQYEKDLEVVWLLYLLLKAGYFSISDQESLSLIDNLLTGRNELAKVMIISCGQFTRGQLDVISNNWKRSGYAAESWLLNYELFSRSMITVDIIKDRLGLDRTLDFYNEMKSMKIRFCNEILHDLKGRGSA